MRRRSFRTGIAIQLALVLSSLTVGVLFLSSSASASECKKYQQPNLNEFFTKQRLFDSCIRDLIGGRGVTFDGDYIGNFVGNPSGGRTQKFRSAWRSTFGLNFDLKKLLQIDGATFRISGAWTAGRNLASDVETIYNPQEIYGLEGARFWELNWQQKLLDGQLDIIVGRQSPAERFNVQPIVWDYVNLAFFSLSLLYNDFAFRTRPIGMWGVSSRFDPQNSPFYFVGGVYSGAPSDVQRISAAGLDFRLQLHKSTLVIGEVGYKKSQMPGDAGLHGTYRAGVVYNSARFTSLSNPADSRRGNVNFYLSGEQALYREESSTTQGLDAFAMVNFPAINDINLIKFFYAGGLSYTGIIDGRDHDKTYAGFSYASLNNVVQQLADTSFHGPAIAPNQPYEAVIEFGHVFQVTPFWAVTPTVQYIINPGITNAVKNAVGLGLQTVVTF